MDNLDEHYWSNRYQNNTNVWDLKTISLPLKEYFDQLTDKNISILIPGCGNAYEAEYLLQLGFTNITLIDISPVPVKLLQDKFANHLNKEIKIILGDFFALNHSFDLIVEQTFFCAIDPSLRQQYANKMYELLKVGGKLVGVMFNCAFEAGPPFGGSKEEYKLLFAQKFTIMILDSCYNSIEKRSGNEVFIMLQKNKL
jgi:methyl halide transferase